MAATHKWAARQKPPAAGRSRPGTAAPPPSDALRALAVRDVAAMLGIAPGVAARVVEVVVRCALRSVEIILRGTTMSGLKRGAVRVLKEARDLLSDPMRWAKLAPNRPMFRIDEKTERKVYLRPDDPACVRWCPVGALAKCGLAVHASYDEIDEADRLLHAALPFGYKSVPRFNDEEWCSHELIMTLFSQAIRLGEGSCQAA
jgi:hypothetical protein